MVATFTLEKYILLEISRVDFNDKIQIPQEDLTTLHLCVYIHIASKKHKAKFD